MARKDNQRPLKHNTTGTVNFGGDGLYKLAVPGTIIQVEGGMDTKQYINTLDEIRI